MISTGAKIQTTRKIIPAKKTKIIEVIPTAMSTTLKKNPIILIMIFTTKAERISCILNPILSRSSRIFFHGENKVRSKTGIEKKW